MNYPIYNPGSVVLTPSAVCESAHVIPGDLATALKDETSVALYRLMHRELKKRSVAVGTHNVGTEALALHRSGYRLCIRPAARPEMDVAVPESKPKTSARKKKPKR